MAKQSAVKRRQRAERSPAAKALRQKISQYQATLADKEQEAIAKFKEVAVLNTQNKSLREMINEYEKHITDLSRELGDMRARIVGNEQRASELEDEAWALLYWRFEKTGG